MGVGLTTRDKKVSRRVSFAGMSVALVMLLPPFNLYLSCYVFRADTWHFRVIDLLMRVILPCLPRISQRVLPPLRLVS